MKIAIIGAGPAALACAAKLAKNKDINLDIYESDNQIGGMTKSLNLWEQTVDLGPHRFFSMDKRINDFWLQYTGEDYLLVKRLTRIFYKQKFFLYPISALNALKNMGICPSIACMWSYLLAQFHPKGNEKSFEEWVSHQFGYKLYSMFFKSYSERLWGISCQELDADFARQRIKKLNLLEVIKSALRSNTKKKHKTLIDQFAYPHYGAIVPYLNIVKEIEKGGARLYLNTPVKGIQSHNRKASGIVLQDGTIREYDYIVSTAPFTDMLCSIEELGEDIHSIAKELKYRNTTLVYLKINKSNLFQDNWIYVHDPSVSMGRITNFQNWSAKMTRGHSETILCLEYWSYDADELWEKSDDKMIDLAKKDIIKTGLVKKEDILEGKVIKIHRSYPVYSMGYKEKMYKLQQAANTIKNLAFIGRNGSFKYNNQDHSILMGLLAAENILSGTQKYDLWNINTDYEYQEGAASSIHKNNTSNN